MASPTVLPFPRKPTPMTTEERVAHAAAALLTDLIANRRLDLRIGPVTLPLDAPVEVSVIGDVLTVNAPHHRIDRVVCDLKREQV